ncbi:uncharacterized protein N7515_008089 [Penicillium bovifimosum]|uniref:mitogen-activated protein kinase kinase n=1 Tax=Penicillium bovifimosum TaxID=126998 RepID=A0A9W9GML2_9EURO|nr:uncharacterized protein N7515_008089 [Penicillium bovifimosum]KAJ5124264.1 hypothetical protein N7515_008089 [Penicillium bovifimosum]
MANTPPQLSLQTTQKNSPTPLPQAPSSLTPPVTPIAKESNQEKTTPNLSQNKKLSQSQFASKENVSTLHFADDLEICRTDDNRPFEFGRGVWSIVYKARYTPSTTNLNPSTPPSSPTTQPQLLAVKAPLRRDANPVLKAEAATLTRLSRLPGHENHLVPFHGYHTELGALIMTAVPTSLATYIEAQAEQARIHRTTATMFDPVQGPASFRDLARKLITGLNWLHEVAGVVHGDIKPHNILLRPIETEGEEQTHAFEYEPLFADFSATVEIQTDVDKPLDTTRASMSSFTPPFTAPEMLASLMCSEMAPTAASDVFSLAATLLAAATGDLLLYSNMNHRLRLEMARAGHQIVDFARSGGSGCRVPRNGFVERLVQPAVVKDPTERISTAKWVELVSV